MWYHKKKRVEVVTIVIDFPSSNSDLRNEIRELTSKVTELVKNQQPTIINNNRNNYTNVFLNEKCRNAYDISKFIAGIDFSKKNHHDLSIDYVGRNAEIISKNYKSLPEFESPVYCFDSKDKHEQIAHIQHKNNWLVEPELSFGEDKSRKSKTVRKVRQN